MSGTTPRKPRTPKKIRARREIFSPSDEIPTRDCSKDLSMPPTPKSVRKDNSNVLTRRSCPDLSKAVAEFRSHPRTRSDNGRNIEQRRNVDGCARCFSSIKLNSEVDPNFTNNSAQAQGSSTSLTNISGSLTNDIIKLWKNKKLCDVIITAGGQEFYAHRLVLAASCEHFTRQTHSNSEAVIHYDLADISAEVMEDVLSFFYTSNINISHVNIEQLLQASQKLGAKKLQDRCCEYLLSINLNNAMKHRVIASKHNLASISKAVDEYMYEHFAAVIDSSSFLKSDFRYVYDTISSNILTNVDELTIFHTCVKWIDFNRDERLKFAVPLMNQVRFSMIPACYIVSQVEPVSFIFDIPECKDMLYIAFRHHALLVEGRPSYGTKQINDNVHQPGSIRNEPQYILRNRETVRKSEKSNKDMKYMMYSTIIDNDPMSKQNNHEHHTDSQTKPMDDTSDAHRKTKHSYRKSLSQDNNDSDVKVKEQAVEKHRTAHHAERNELNADKNKSKNKPKGVDRNPLNTDRTKSKVKPKCDPAERAFKNQLNTDKNKTKVTLMDDAVELHDTVKNTDKRKSSKRSRMSSKSPNKTRQRHRLDSTIKSPEKMPITEAKVKSVVDSSETGRGHNNDKKISHEDLANNTDFTRPNGADNENKNGNKASMIDLVKNIADKTMQKQRIKTSKNRLKTTLDDNKANASPRKLQKESLSMKHSKMIHKTDFNDSGIKSTFTPKFNKAPESVNNHVSKHATKDLLGNDDTIERYPSHREQLTDIMYTDHPNKTNIRDMGDSNKDLASDHETYTRPVNKHSMNALTTKSFSSTKPFNERLSDSHADPEIDFIEPIHEMSVTNNSANNDAVSCLECESIHRQRGLTMDMQQDTTAQEITPAVRQSLNKTTIGRQSMKRHAKNHSGTMHMNTKLHEDNLHKHDSTTLPNEIGGINSNDAKFSVSKHSNSANNSVIRRSESESTIEYDYIPHNRKTSRAVKPSVATSMQYSNEPSKACYSSNQHSREASESKYPTTTNKHTRGNPNECLDAGQESIPAEDNDYTRKEFKHVLRRRHSSSQTIEPRSTTMKERTSLPEDNHDILHTDISMHSSNAESSNPLNVSDQQKERALSIHKKPSTTHYFKNTDLGHNELNVNPVQIINDTKFVVPRMLLMDSSDTDNSLSSHANNNWPKFSKDKSKPTDSKMNDKTLHQQKERALSIHKKPSTTHYFKNTDLGHNELNVNPEQIINDTKFVVPRMLLMDSSDTDNSLSSHANNNWPKFSKDKSKPTDSKMNDKTLHQQKSKDFLSDIRSRPKRISKDRINEIDDGKRVESDSRLFEDPIAEFRNETNGELAPGYVLAMSKRWQVANTIIRGLLQLREPCIHNVSDHAGTQKVKFKTCEINKRSDVISQPFQGQQSVEDLVKSNLTNSDLLNLPPKPFPPTAILVVGCESAHGTKRTKESFFVQQFNPKKNIWSLKCYLPMPINRSGSAVLKGNFYVCGGLKVNFGTKVAVNDCHRYDAASGHWELVAPLNTARSGHAAVTLFSRIYVLGGEDSYGFSCDTMEYYDIDKNYWKVVGAMLESRTALAAVAHRGRIMMAGGMFDKEQLKALNTVEVYDPRTGICSYVFPLPVAVCDSAMADVNDVVYLVGGYVIENGEPLSLDSILRYRDETDSWDLYRKLLVPRHNLVAVGIGKKLYVIGGQSSASKNHALANIECIKTLLNELAPDIPPLLKPVYGISGCVFQRQR